MCFVYCFCAFYIMYDFISYFIGYISTVFTRESILLRASLPSSGRLSVCLTVRLSVRLSVCYTRDLYQNGAS